MLLQPDIDMSGFSEIRDTKKLQINWLEEITRTWFSINKCVKENVSGTWDVSAEEMRLAGKKILMTGCTGFLGCGLLLEILEHTKGHVSLILLGRRSKNASLEQRFADTLRYYQCYDDVKEYSFECMKFIEVDLQKEYFGIAKSEKEWMRKLCPNGVDIIFHIAAHVNHTISYRQLYSSNVEATARILKLAALVEGNGAIVHFISSGATVKAYTRGHYIREVRETDDLFSDKSIQGVSNLMGYIQTKWVCEGICLKARAVGLPVVIYRPSMIGAHKKYGVMNPRDWMTFLIQACILLRMYPSTLDRTVDLISLDTCCAAIISLAQNPASLKYPALHLNNEQYKTPLKTMLELTNMCINDEMQAVPFEEWLMRVRKNAVHHPTKLYPVLELIDTLKPSHRPQTTTPCIHHNNLTRSLLPKDVQALYKPIDIAYMKQFLEKNE